MGAVKRRSYRSVGDDGKALPDAHEIGQARLHTIEDADESLVLSQLAGVSLRSAVEYR
jgi:hypothetical protein